MRKYLCNYNQMRAKNKYITGKTNNLLLTNVISKQIIYYFICKLYKTLWGKRAFVYISLHAKEI